MAFILEKEPKSPIAEAYRMLRTNIQYSSFDKKIKSILVTSATPSEGKSTTSGNLALTFDQEGKRVLLVDCDLRKPVLHKNFSISNQIGLSDYIAGQVELAQCIVEYKENLHLIPSGKIPPNPSEMLSSQKMKEFVKEISEEYDVVIIDSPPVIAVTDAQIISTYVDGVVLVVASGKVDKDAVLKAKEKFTQVKAHMLGAVLTQVPVDKKGYGYKNYYYYGKEEKHSKKSKRKGA